jgi:MFS family permease
MLGLVGSPVLAGVLIAHFSWHSIFLLNVPVVALALLAGMTLMPESRGPRRKPDLPGAVLSAVGMLALVWWIIRLPQHGAFHGGGAVSLGVAVLALTGFVVWENVTPEPMVPLALFKARDFSGGSLSLALVEVGSGGLLLVLTQYLQFVHGYSPIEAGLAFTPLAVAALVGNSLGAALAAKIGNRLLMLSGMLSMAAAFGLLATVSADSAFAVPAVGLGLLGLGAGLAMPAAVGALMATIPPEQAGVGSALNDTIGQAGSALGIAILGSMLASGYARHLPAAAPAGARASIAAAFADAHGDSGLIQAARTAFSSAMSTTFTVSAIGMLAAATLAAVLMRGGRQAPADGAQDAQPGEASDQVAGAEPELVG